VINDDTRILVLCTGNSCRSQMAEGFLRHYLGQLGLPKAAASVRSAGLEPHGLNPAAVVVMAESGVDISHHRSTALKEYLGDTFDYVITVCDNAAARCPSFPGSGIRLHWPFEDPAGATGPETEVLGVFRRVRDQIATRTKAWLSSEAPPASQQQRP